MDSYTLPDEFVHGNSFGSTVSSIFFPNVRNRIDNLEEGNISRAYNAWQADTAYERMKEMAADERAWYEQMSNTAIQRSVEDYKKAGLNPYLAYTQGGAATAMPTAVRPSGATSSPVNFSKSSKGLMSSFSDLLKGLSAFLAVFA